MERPDAGGAAEEAGGAGEACSGRDLGVVKNEDRRAEVEAGHCFELS